MGQFIKGPESFRIVKMKIVYKEKFITDLSRFH